MWLPRHEDTKVGTGLLPKSVERIRPVHPVDGQRNRQMRFSIAPKNLDVNTFRNPPQCDNDRNHCAHTYPISDVYYAEVCVVSHVCRNRARLFSLEVGELFECDIDESAFRELRELLSG